MLDPSAPPAHAIPNLVQLAQGTPLAQAHEHSHSHAERGVESPDHNPDLCGAEGSVFTQNPLEQLGKKSHPLVAGTKVHLLTFGCQMNKYDSEMVAGLLNEKGAAFVEDPEAAQLLIMNTCSVRGHAEDRVFNRLHVLKERKQREPGFVLAVMGCMAQKEGEHIAKKFPWVDLIVGTRMLDEFPKLLERVREGARTPLLAIDEKPDVKFGETVARRENKFMAYLTVTRGCNKKCTYCVVPYTRGPEVSRSIDDVVAEAKRLVDDGVMEIMLLGQTIDTYGYDLKNDSNLWKLLRALYPISGLKRIRFITSHPEECREELFATMAELGDKVMPFIHMPPQSGSDRMLRRMKRGYKRERYLDVVAAARKACPEIEFCGDWIVGFCGESDEDFEQSLSLMDEVRFQSSYVFKYSVREGTPAQKLPDDIPESVKKERHARLSDLQEKISLEKNQSRIGQIEEVLVESPSKVEGKLAGRTRSHRMVHFAGTNELIGTIAKVKITSATALSLQGEVVN
ncbi:MAG TPA: tRNA (N6-isopentenyl adenosine(37)-C2)-methylthiotransferase MiaB [Planctomycetota bacterium]|nr:tRNA (N6-isopentenyl adenosine(37)-C2)-methylthiotransferase MiaB [Planctomycetota bacterium]